MVAMQCIERPLQTYAVSGLYVRRLPVPVRTVSPSNGWYRLFRPGQELRLRGTGSEILDWLARPPYQAAGIMCGAGSEAPPGQIHVNVRPQPTGPASSGGLDPVGMATKSIATKLGALAPGVAARGASALTSGLSATACGPFPYNVAAAFRRLMKIRAPSRPEEQTLTRSADVDVIINRLGFPLRDTPGHVYRVQSGKLGFDELKRFVRDALGIIIVEALVGNDWVNVNRRPEIGAGPAAMAAWYYQGQPDYQPESLDEC